MICDQAYGGVCEDRERGERGRERKQFKNVQCHCSVDYKSLRSTAQRRQQGAEQFWQQRQLRTTILPVQVSVISSHLNQKREQHKPHCPY